MKKKVFGLLLVVFAIQASAQVDSSKLPLPSFLYRSSNGAHIQGAGKFAHFVRGPHRLSPIVEGGPGRWMICTYPFTDDSTTGYHRLYLGTSRPHDDIGSEVDHVPDAKNTRGDRLNRHASIFPDSTSAKMAYWHLYYQYMKAQ